MPIIGNMNHKPLVKHTNIKISVIDNALCLYVYIYVRLKMYI